VINESFLGRFNDQEPMLVFSRNDFQEPNQVQISNHEARIIPEPFSNFGFVIYLVLVSCILEFPLN